jgi:hypothetical protein
MRASVIATAGLACSLVGDLIEIAVALLDVA